uniref:Matrin-type domain-containing protein n=3 Tax=Myripristis murdjan TaxID=586833 RepID=A0A667Z146_9TELE
MSTQSLSKSTPSSNSSLVSSPSKLDKSKDLPEATTTATTSSTSPSKVSTSSSLPSTEPHSSFAHKTQNKTTTAVAKSPVKTPSAGLANSGVRTRASSAATKMPKGDVSEQHKAASAVTEGVVVKSDHQVLAETTLAKSVKSQTKMDTSSEMQSSPQGEELDVASQTQTGSFLLRSDAQSQGGLFSPLESGSNEETLKKDLKNTSDKGKEDSIENLKEAEEDECGGYQILDSLDDQAGEEMDSSHLRDQDGTSEMQLTEPQDSSTLNDETYEVLDSVDDEGRTCQEDDNEMAMNDSFRVLDSVIEDKTTVDQKDYQLIKDDKDMVLKPSEEEMSETNKSDDESTITGTVGKEDETSKEAKFQVVDSVSEQSPKDQDDKKKRNQKVEADKYKTASTESSQDTNKAAKDNVENQDTQIPNKEVQNLDFEDQPPQHSTDTVKTPECTVQEQKTFQILDSVDKTTTEDHKQRHETGHVLESPSGQMVVKDIRQIEEGEEDQEEETYEVIDSVEDQLVTTAQMETEKKEKTTKRGKRTARKEDKPTNGSGSSIRLSKNDEKSPKKEVKKYHTQRKKIGTLTGTSEKEEEAQEVIEESMLQVVDSVEEEPGQDAVNNTAGFSRRRSARRNKEDNATPNLTGALEKMDREEEEAATYEILDSVEDETVNYDPPATERSDSRKMERTKKEVKNEDIKTLQKEDTPTRKRHTPARDSAEGNREKTPKIEDKVTKKESTPTKTSDIVIKEVSKEQATYQILDSVEDETVNDDPIITQRSGGRGRRGRAKKTAQSTKKGSTPLKKNNNDAPEEAIGEEEEATYQVLDSLEDETVDDPVPAKLSERGRRGRAKKEDKMTKNTDKQTQSSDSLAASTKNKEEEEEPVYQVVDAVEEDKVHVQDLTTTEGSDRRRKEQKKTEDKISEKKDTPTKTSNTTIGASEKIVVKDEALYEVVDSVEEDPTPEEESGRGRKERTPKKEAKKEDKLPQKSQSNLSPLESEKKDKSHKKGERTEEKQTTAMSVLVNLDEVSEEEEDYPDDTAEEEELRKRQAAAKEKQLAIEREREEKRVRQKEERERRGSSSRGGRRRVKGRGREKEEEEEEEEKVGVDPKELVTLDEVGADEAEDEVGGGPRSQEMDGGITEGELQALVTLDEIVGEEEESTLPEPLPPSQEDESGDFFNPETLVTLDETGCEDDEKKEKQAEKTSSVVKRKHNMDKTEESINFLTVDEVGAEEEEEVTTRGRGRAKKRMRQTPVRKSTRGKQASMKEEKVEEKTPPAADVSPPDSLDTSSSLVKEEPVSSGDGQPELLKIEAEEGATQSSLGDLSAGQELQPRPSESHNEEDGTEVGEELKKEEEARSRAASKVFSKRRREVIEQQAKRSRSQSPSVPADFKLPPFRPNNPLGLEFVVPQRGFICNLCSMFYLNESVAKETHCSSQRHYDNMQKYYQKLQEEQSRRSRGGSAPGLSSD